MSPPSRAFKSTRASQHRTRILARGNSRDSSSPHPGEVPVVILRVQILSCHDLEAKSSNGYSDPFVIVSILGQQFRTPVCKRSLNPVYEPKDATFDFPIYTSLVHQLGALEFVVWDKDMIRNDYLGEYSLPIHLWFKETAFGFDDHANRPFSVDLVSSRSATTVRGNMSIKVGFVHPPNSTDLPDFGKTYALIKDPALIKAPFGIVILEICGAKDLPEWSNLTRTGWDMDPFVEVSTANKVVGTTPVIRHSRNPVWDKQLFFHVREDDLSLPIQFTVFDRGRFTSNEYVGGAEINVATLVEGAAKKDLNSGLSPDDVPTMRDFELPLTPAEKPGRVYNPIPTITFRAGYQSYDSLKKQVGQGA